MTEWQSITTIPEEQEIWKNVVGYEGLYEVSSYGRVRSLLSNYKILKPHVSWCGYLHVSLCNNGDCRTKRIALIVATAFLGPRPHGQQINHIDGVKLNNQKNNLEYITPSQNVRHAIALGLYNDRKGSNNNLAKLNDSGVLAIRKSLAQGLHPKDIAKAMGVSPTTIKDIRKGKTWKHLL